MHKSLVKLVRKIEHFSTQPRWRVVVKDYDSLYLGECCEGLNKEQFDFLVNQQDKNTQVIIVEVCENEPSAEQKNLTFKVENHVGKNVSDFLKGYDELIKISRSPKTEIIAKSVEVQVYAVDSACGCSTAEQAKLIAQAQEVIKNAPLH